ncbi:MAG: hypothetical protein LBF60_05210 [Treponema sp.]|jgi:hypothetical protein|nr:hypothetical protein [Treponema sp.]
MGIAPGEEGAVDKLRAVVAVDAQKGGLDWMFGRASTTHFWGFIEERAEFDPSGSGIGGV